MIKLDLAPSFKQSQKTLATFCARKGNIAKVQDISHTLAAVFQRGNQVLACGNGGSSCDATHFAEEFVVKLRQDRQALPAIALSETSALLAAANDYGFEHIFARGVEAYGRPGDMLVAISTSGNSPNIIRAVKAARLKKMITVGLLGRDGGRMKGLCDFELIVNGPTSDRIQEAHMAILHIIIEGVERVLFPENYRR
jgi:D-sedoheptulose 7-phosphate isomerase